MRGPHPPVTSAAMTVVRRLEREEIDAVADLTARVFGKADEVAPLRALMRAAYETCPFMPPELCWVAEEEGRIVAKWQMLDFEMWVAGTPVRTAGIQGVVAEPDANHKGYARLIAEHAIGEVRNEGFDMVFGFAQRGGFYTRLGGVPLCADYMLELDARAIPRLQDDPFRPSIDADLPTLIRCYNESNRHGSGPLVRSEALWPWLVRRPERMYLCDDGYVGVTFFDDRLEIREVAGAGPAFHAAAVRKLGELAREANLRRICGAVPADHPFVAAATPHGATLTTTYSKRSGCLGMPLAPLRLLGRLTDSLGERLRGSTSGQVALDLGVESGGERTRVLLNGAAGNTRKVDLVLSPGALLQLAMGYRAASEVLAGEAGWQTTPPGAEDIALLDVVFPRCHPFMWHTDRY